MASDPRLAALMSLVKIRLGVEKPRQVAAAIGMADVDAERRVARWLKGESAPNFGYTMTVLSEAGLLTEEADRAWKGLPALTAQEAAAAAAEAASEAAAQTPREREGPSRRRRATS